ncbi:MAG: hypothetical protein M3235_01040 [Actinomycetota bacterium]|nr:hypothetical protein [Actinomycetota bacterium]
MPSELDPDHPVLVTCRTAGARIAAGILADAGYRATVLDAVGVTEFLKRRHAA